MFKLRLWGNRLGATDGPQPLLTFALVHYTLYSLHCHFNLQQLFKVVLHRGTSTNAAYQWDPVYLSIVSIKKLSHATVPLKADDSGQ